jgi:hypothetical protein
MRKYQNIVFLSSYLSRYNNRLFEETRIILGLLNWQNHICRKIKELISFLPVALLQTKLWGMLAFKSVFHGQSGKSGINL